MAFTRSGAWFACLTAVVLASCSPRPAAAPPAAPAPDAPAPEPAATIPVAPPAMNRAELLSIVSQAASAYAAGQPAPERIKAAAGRRFSVHVPFGCLGPTSEGAARYSYDEAKGSLRLAARAESWTQDATIRSMAASAETEAIEGFWIPRPWLSADACPAVQPSLTATDAAKAPPVSESSPQTVGLVSVFEAGDSRLQQRGSRAYEVVRKSPPPAGAFRLVLEGRVVERADGAAPVTCHADGPNVRPLCLVHVVFDRVAIESDTGEMYGEWRS